MKNRIIIFIITALVFGLLSFWYISLGGFNDIELQIANVPAYQIAGKSFEGRHKDAVLEKIFFEVKEQINTGNLSGTLTVIDYHHPQRQKGYVNLFIGVLLKNTFSPLPEGFEMRNLPSGKVVQANIDAHNLVMPSPEKIQNSLKQFASAKDLQLEDYSVEKIYSDKQIQVEIPVKE